MKLNGTNFQVKVWKALKKIKKGKVKTYKEVAMAINSLKQLELWPMLVQKIHMRLRYLVIVLLGLMEL